MSDRVHTTDEIREFVTYGDWGTQEYPGEWFDAWLKSHDAEVERAAAEKAWDRGYTCGFYDREKLSGDSRDASEGSTENPYRAEAYRQERGE